MKITQDKKLFHLTTLSLIGLIMFQPYYCFNAVIGLNQLTFLHFTECCKKK